MASKNKPRETTNVVILNYESGSVNIHQDIFVDEVEEFVEENYNTASVHYMTMDSINLNIS